MAKEYPILLVDDDLIPRHFVREVLEAFGYSPEGIREAENGEEALSYIKKGYRPRLIIMDTQLNYGARGYEICRILRNSGERMPIIGVSSEDGDCDGEFETRWMEAGANVFMLKCDIIRRLPDLEKILSESKNITEM